MSTMTVQELRRRGSNVLEQTPVTFEWSAQNHSMTQDTLDLEMQVNTVREMPPGADEPVEHAMSVEWSKDTSFHGEWRDQWAGVGFADRTCTEFAQMVGRVPMVRITLGPWILVGIITNFKIRWRTSFEIGWTFTFSVHVNETIAKARRQDITPLTAVDFTQRVSNIEELSEIIQDSLISVSSLPTKAETIDNARDNLVDLQDSVGKTRTAVESVAFEGSDDPLSSLTDQIASRGKDISEILDRAQHKLLSVAAAFSGLRAQAQTTLLDVQELVSSDVLAYEDVIATLQFEEWSRTQYEECVKIIGQAKAGEVDARARAARRPRGIHRVRSGDTLDRVSMKWYGSPDSGRLIRDANNLDSIVLPVGADLIIPDVTT